LRSQYILVDEIPGYGIGAGKRRRDNIRTENLTGRDFDQEGQLILVENFR
jgi:hypothetical protein